MSVFLKKMKMHAMLSDFPSHISSIIVSKSIDGRENMREKDKDQIS